MLSVFEEHRGYKLFLKPFLVSGTAKLCAEHVSETYSGQTFVFKATSCFRVSQAAR